MYPRLYVLHVGGGEGKVWCEVVADGGDVDIPKMKNWKVGKLLSELEEGLEASVNVILHEDPMVLTVQLHCCFLKKTSQAVVRKYFLFPALDGRNGERGLAMSIISKRWVGKKAEWRGERKKDQRCGKVGG